MIRRLALAAALLLQGTLPTFAQDASDFIVRLNRIEGQMRQLSGQVEQLQHENRQLKEQLRKFQEDVEFRFNERSGGRSATPAPPPGAKPERPARRSDAFDPASDPAAPGAPRPLGSANAAPPPAASPGPGRGGIASIIEGEDDAPPGGRPLDLGAAGRGGGAAAGRPSAAPPRAEASVAAPAGSGDARADYDVAYAFLIQRQLDRAEASFRGFLQAYPRDRLVPDATYWLGDTYLQRNKPREAAELFLKVSTEHARSPKAPDALLKLGVALSSLGARDQACAAFAEVERKYPGAPSSVKQGVDREQKKARCPA